MNIIVTDSYEASCREAANQLLSLIKTNPQACLGLVAGGTAQGVCPALPAVKTAPGRGGELKVR